ncbi:SapC family protein [Neptunomonas sp.]|uniref:SapC family protein n=1 Tax=Neptunomonas sp. TaxID=1971898 RepID=UPI0025F2D1EE|nr:SapC family protein [Neptunomonas sp.]
MAHYIPIQKESHLNAGFTPIKNLSFAAGMTTVPIVIEEISHVIEQMSIALQKVSSNGDTFYELVAIQSLTPQSNLFVLDDGRWIGEYKPAFYRAHPFSLRPDDHKKQLNLCIANEYVVEEPTQDDARFFDDSEEFSPRIKEITDFLAHSLRGRKITLDACEVLNKANLLAPWPIKYSEPDKQNKPQPKTLNGLYHIDKKVLNTLSAEALKQLHSCGALEVAFAQIFSEPRLKKLTTLQTIHRQIKKKHLKQEITTQEPDLDSLFGNNDDLFSF